MFGFLIAPDDAPPGQRPRAESPRRSLAAAGALRTPRAQSPRPKRTGHLRHLLDGHVHGWRTLLLRAGGPGEATVTAVWHLEHRGAEHERREPAGRFNATTAAGAGSSSTTRRRLVFRAPTIHLRTTNRESTRTAERMRWQKHGGLACVVHFDGPRRID